MEQREAPFADPHLRLHWVWNRGGGSPVVEHLEREPQEELLRGLGSSHWRRGDLLVFLSGFLFWFPTFLVFLPLTGGGSQGEVGLCSQGMRDGMRGNGLKLHPGRFRLVTRKNFFIGRVVKRWSREVEESFPLEVFRNTSGCHFKIWFGGPGIQLGQRLDLMISEAFTNPNDSVIQ